MAIFATFPSSKERWYSKNLLAFSPFEAEGSQDSESHFKFAAFVLDLFGRDFTIVVSNTETIVQPANALPGRLNVALWAVVVTNLIWQFRILLKRMRNENTEKSNSCGKTSESDTPSSQVLVRHAGRPPMKFLSVTYKSKNL